VLQWELGDLRRCAESLAGLAGTMAASGQGERAAWLWGAATALRETLGVPQLPPKREFEEHAVAAAREALGEQRWAVAYTAGKALLLEEAIVEAFADERGPRW
jgi:hypothetical protein